MCIYFITISSAVIIFVLTQIILKFFIEPTHALKYTISKTSLTIQNDYELYQNADCLDKTDVDRSYKNLRELAIKLTVEANLIPFYNVTSKVFNLPKDKNIKETSDKLFKISNDIFNKSLNKHENISAHIIQILKLLNAPIPSRFEQFDTKI